MPMYDYQCNTCGHRFEVRQSFHDEPLTSCPECTGVVRRVIHPTGVIFKGSGWYITDSRPSNGNGSLPAASDDSESKKDQEPKSEKKEKSDTKAEKSKSEATSSTD